MTELAARRRPDVIKSIMFSLGGINYGPFTVSAPYVKGEPIALYFVSADGEDSTNGPLDALITDDVTLALDSAMVR